MIAIFKYGDPADGEGRAIVTDVYRDGRSLFDPAVGVQLTIDFQDANGYYVATGMMTMSIAEAIDLQEKLSAFLERVKSHQPTHERYR